MTTAIKTAVIGYGFSAKTFHIPFITSLEEFELTAISSSKAEEVKSDWPQAMHYLSADELLVNSDAELVIITAPNDVHFALAKKALENNKHVIIEKPFVTDVAQGQELIELANRNNLVLSVYHNRRWDGDFLTIKKMINGGKFGDVKHYESHFDRFRPAVRQRWREQAEIGGGILFDLGSHLIDQAITLFGIPKAVTAQCETMREGSNNVDYFHVILHYPNNLAILHADLFSAGPNKRFTVKGTQGSFEKYGLDPQEERLIAGAQPIENTWSEETPDQHGVFYTLDESEKVPSEHGGYQHYFVGMAQAIREGKDAPVKAEDALWNIKLIELAMQSSQSGQTVSVNPELS
ncbi:oxidoreductase [Vibrio marisflavi]|uniref:Oxidoreductase YdgJ n=1 Tax=Vibrio marisflavi CECT 7928 TaxID=634439 RepID=A0ABN8DZG8_9VIBR|nr:oxidoreductase [Vibrio marisflavi]CAH0536084.1 putative oxidoreductase YdgJ [Vibrio marisflavi CECT 7928]